MVQPLEPGRLRGLLVDLDGVLYVGDELIPGAVEAVASLASRGLELRFLTNTTTRSRQLLLERLQQLGIPARARQLFTPAALGRRAIQRSDSSSYRLLGADALADDLGPGRLALEDTATPGWVVLGLHPPMFRHEMLSLALRDLLNGARLLALHSNRCWRTKRGMELGLGAYVQALAYAAKVEPLVIGKPSPAFFDEALADLGLPREAVAMIGDDVETDVGGAQALGVAGILVRTGKFSERALAASGVTPALIVDDIAAFAAGLEAG